MEAHLHILPPMLFTKEKPQGPEAFIEQCEAQGSYVYEVKISWNT